MPAPLTSAADGTDVVYGVRPEHLALANGGEGLAGQVAVVEPTGADTHVVVRAAEHEILAVFRERHAFQPGQQITLRPDVASANLFEESGGTRLH